MNEKMDYGTLKVTCGQSVKAALKLAMVVLLGTGMVLACSAVSASAAEPPQSQNEKIARSTSSQKVDIDCGSLGELPLKSGLSEAVTNKKVNCDILSANNQGYLDFAAPNIDYLETYGGPLDTEKGWQYGGQTSCTVQKDWLRLSNLYFNGTFTWTHATITHGQTNGFFNGIPTNSDIKNFDFRLGKAFEIGNHAQITPYFGIGTAFWDRDLSGQGGSVENYGHSYAGGGPLVQYSPFHQWVLSAYGLAGRTFGSHLSVRVAPIPPSSFDFTLGNDTTYMAGASADHAITRRWHANVGMDWTRFKYGHSAALPTGLAGLGVLEPDSRTSNVTVKAGFGYSF